MGKIFSRKRDVSRESPRDSSFPATTSSRVSPQSPQLLSPFSTPHSTRADSHSGPPARLAGISSPQWPLRSAGPPWLRCSNSRASAPLLPSLYSRDPPRSTAIGLRSCLRHFRLSTCAGHRGGPRGWAATALADAHVTSLNSGPNRGMVGPEAWEPSCGVRQGWRERSWRARTEQFRVLC